MLEEIMKLSRRKDFKPFIDLGVKQICAPIRKNVKEISRILAVSEKVSVEDRVQYGKLAGMEFKEGENSIQIEYNEVEALKKLALILFSIDEEEVKDWDNMDEGEVNAGLKVFFMKRNGI